MFCYKELHTRNKNEQKEKKNIIFLQANNNDVTPAQIRKNAIKGIY